MTTTEENTPEKDYHSSAYHYECISGYVTKERYNKDIQKTVLVETQVHHVLGHAEKLATDVLYDLLMELQEGRTTWLRIGHTTEAHCYSAMIKKVEAKIRMVISTNPNR